ncbi:hypothetical protein [Rhizobium sp. BR 314]|uniref:hypothetical protein n=1 Tax=Rhizobium sp. BR 314 TaxID=3040013 RepID=UPI0039BF69B3
MSPSSRLSNDLATLWIEAPMVIAMRMQHMRMSALTGSVNAAELNRMVMEKLVAAGESAVAVNMALAQQSISTVTAMASGAAVSSHRAADTVARAAVKPYSKRVWANVTRLSKHRT